MAQMEEVRVPSNSQALKLALVKSLATPCDFADGESIFRAGQADIDLFIVESGSDRNSQPDGRRSSDCHSRPGTVSGDIDLLTGRPVIVTAVARGTTRVWRVPNSQLRRYSIAYRVLVKN